MKDAKDEEKTAAAKKLESSMVISGMNVNNKQSRLVFKLSI